MFFLKLILLKIDILFDLIDNILATVHQGKGTFCEQRQLTKPHLKGRGSQFSCFHSYLVKIYGGKIGEMGLSDPKMVQIGKFHSGRHLKIAIPSL